MDLHKLQKITPKNYPHWEKDREREKKRGEREKREIEKDSDW